MYRKTVLTILLMLLALTAAAQHITGIVTDAATGEPLPFVNVRHSDGRGMQTAADGSFRLPFRAGKLQISFIGYETQSVAVRQAGSYDVKLKPVDLSFNEAVVTGHRTKYSRKNNPAVELMRKVIAAKRHSALSANHDYYSRDRYSKLTLALNDVTEKVFEEGKFKRMPFLKEHVEVDNRSGKLVLPLSVDESVTREIYRRSPETQKSIVLGQRSSGVNDLFNTGDILKTVLQDCFSDVDIYEDEVRLLQYPFISPISSRSAIGFYRYFIEDTLMVAGQRCIQVGFTPNNSQDFGFSGNLYIAADSTYRVCRVSMGIPVHSGVNFVESMSVEQEFEQLPSGEQTLRRDDMFVLLKVASFLQKVQVRRLTEYRDISFAEIPDRMFHFKGEKRTEANAMMRDDAYWAEQRPEELSSSESRMSLFIKRLESIKGFNFVLFVLKAFIENNVETTADPARPSKVDIGPINTMITQNAVDGLRLRASAQTTANLHPHLFLKGYVAYGFRDHRWKGMGEVTYSFNKKAYLPREFPVNNLTFTYTRDVMAPTDKFLPTDKDNVFVSFKWTRVDHMMYYENYRLQYDREWENGLRFKAQLRTEEDEPALSLFYQPLNGSGPSPEASAHRRKLRTTDLSAEFRYQPGATWVNTKQRRIAANNDAPIYSLSHTTGLKGVGGSDYTYNLTEAGIYKRFWMNSWGRIDAFVKGGVQWNRVPFPLLIMPAANLSYITEDGMFNLINNMEFLNDRYASLAVSWDMNGKIFNRIPLLRKLKWREYIGCNVLWGTLSSKNNPFLEKNASDARLFYFPGTWNADGQYEYLSTVMDPKKPYVEVIAGIHNIFKLIHVEYVRRLTYLDRPGTDRWGIRFMVRVTF